MSEAARRRLEAALRLLGADPAAADALTRADALWLARVLPDVDTAEGDDQRGAGAGDEGGQGVAPAASSQTGGAGDDDAGASKTREDVDALRRGGDTTALFVQQDGVEDEPMLHARRVPVPAADALPGRAALERALRPFLRRRPSRVRREVDAAATAEASAEASADALRTRDRPGRTAPALVPVLRPVPERWFDVVLLAERDDTMRVFEDTLRELRQLLARHGAFRRVGLWRWRVQGDAVQVETAAGMPCAPRAMLQGQHPQLVWVLTHGASARWAEAPLRDFVRRLAAQSVVAIVQLLPETAWGATALGEARERVRSRERAATNRQLLRRDPWGEVWSRAGVCDVVPMLPLQADALARWAEFVMSPRALEHVAVALEDVADEVHEGVEDGEDGEGVGGFGGAEALDGPEAAALPPSPPGGRAPPQAASATVSPAVLREQVLRFKAIASPQAFALLRLLSGAWITLPVMRLLQHSMQGPRTLSPLAEVLLSGLLRRTSAADVRPEELSFDFVPGVREWLSGSLSGDERRMLDAAMADSREAIRQFVETRLNRTLNSFGALLLDPAGDEFLPASARSFVEVSRRLRALRGGADGGLPLAGIAPAARGAAGAADEVEPTDVPYASRANDAAEAGPVAGPQAAPQVDADPAAPASSAGASVTTGGRALRILHLSDLHIGLENPVDFWRQRVMMGEAWLDNLHHIQRQAPVDLVCLTGDVAMHGLREEYREATDFVRQTMSALGLPMERFFCVPGNHDIDRRDIDGRGRRLGPLVEQMRPAVLSELLLAGSKAQYEAATLRDTLDRRRAAYHAWLQEIQREALLPYAHDHGRLGFRMPVPLGDGATVYVVGLDSAALSGSPDDDFAPRLTSGQLNRLLGLPALRGHCIALIHHPLDELADRADAERQLAAAGACLLHGGQRTVGAPNWERRLSGVDVFPGGFLHRVPGAPTSVQVLDLVLHPGTGASRPRLEALRVSCREWSDGGRWQDAGVAQSSATATPAPPREDIAAPAPAPASAAVRPLDIYISYRKEDSAAAADLCRLLEAEGHRPWLDRDNLKAGDDALAVSEQALREADVFLLCVSVPLKRRGYMQQELELALHHESTLPKGTGYILPVRLKPCELPPAVSHLAAADLFEVDGHARLLSALAQKQRQLLAQATPAAPAAPEVPRRPRIFISYAREDLKSVRTMAPAVESLGFECVWFDVYEKVARSAEEIEAAIESCDHFMAVLSAAADRRPSGRYWEEWRRAAERQQRTDGDYLLLVSVDKRRGQRAVYERIAARMPPAFGRIRLVHAAQGRLDDDAQLALHSLRQKVPLQPGPPLQKPAEREAGARPAPRIYISSARADAADASRLEKYLRTLSAASDVLVFGGGLRPPPLEEEGLDDSHVYVLLLSDSYLSSTFPMQVEAAHALCAMRDRGARVCIVLLSPCDWMDLRPGNDPALPRLGELRAAGPYEEGRLVSMREVRDVDAAWRRIVQGIRAALGDDPPAA